jgi:hypothetical protein
MKKRKIQLVLLGSALIGFVLWASPAKANGADEAQTPMTSDGHPDLNGMWRNTGGGIRQGSITSVATKQDNGDASLIFSSRRCAPNQKGFDGTGCHEETNETTDFEFVDRLDTNRPLYKPEFWDKVQDLDVNTNSKDPVFTCEPLGVPRMGPPSQIMQTATYIAFFYAGYPTTEFRVIPIDGRQHDPEHANDISFFGESIGRWEGKTLVIDSVGFTDQTWLAGGLYGSGGGYFHSYDMHVVEKLTRDGNKIRYEVTVNDPTVLLKPWVMNPANLVLDPNKQDYVHEGDLCSQPDQDRVVTKVRH